MEAEACKKCGYTEFKKGKLGNGYVNLMPINSFFSSGSPMIVTFCGHCGEVSSVSVEKPRKF
ncbi:hypothetical protein [Mesobacillus zeae]|uniref:Transcription initiation factor TFIIIB n=1 Tax=Mesobacillus zeae TaxID=1917180 RepID=A0A398AX47_9BACI|nr:hypothetical protein [Mesobacillus zeae]RID82239.1 hypothetical protein D1970_19605 [Mesobacillus zeae]